MYGYVVANIALYWKFISRGNGTLCWLLLAFMAALMRFIIDSNCTIHCNDLLEVNKLGYHSVYFTDTRKCCNKYGLYL